MRCMKEKKEERKPRKGTLGSRSWMNKTLRQETAEGGQSRVEFPWGHGKRRRLLPSQCSFQGTASSTYPEPGDAAGLGMATWISLA